MGTQLQLGRLPATDNELWHVVKTLWGMEIPRERVCEGHSSPFEAFADAYYARQPWALWYGARGSGKSLLLATLGLTKAALLNVDVTLLGGSMAQSNNVREHIDQLLRHKYAPTYSIEQSITTQIKFNHGNWIRPLPASQTTVRGPHPAMTLLDEIDEMDYDLYVAAQGQAMPQKDINGDVVRECTVASSTWQRPDATFKKVIDEARLEGRKVHLWCLEENREPHGWMTTDFIERKKATVPAAMWRTEYLLGEPSGISRAFDAAAIESTFQNMETVHETEKGDDITQVFEKPENTGMYAAGADWAKEHDHTVIVVMRTDVHPYKCVYFRRIRRHPWPYMINSFNEVVNDYHASSAHDATGLGNVVTDLVSERTTKVVMVGKNRTELLTSYINAVEQGKYALPRNSKAYDAHRSCSVAAVFYPGKSHSHLPDEVAAFALAHRATGDSDSVVGGVALLKPKTVSDADRNWVQKLDYPTQTVEEQYTRVEGNVKVLEEETGVDVFWSF